MPDTDNTATDSPRGTGSSTSEQAQPRLPTTEEQLQEIHIGGMTPLVGRIQIDDYNRCSEVYLCWSIYICNLLSAQAKHGFLGQSGMQGDRGDPAVDIPLS
jgi:hypothetical protein